jgi:hypothetical protein
MRDPVRDRRPPPLVVAVGSTRGGVGKPTLIADLVGLLTDLGRRVCLVDGDIHLTLWSYFHPLSERVPPGPVDAFAVGDAASAFNSTAIGGAILLIDTPGTLYTLIYRRDRTVTAGDTLILAVVAYGETAGAHISVHRRDRHRCLHTVFGAGARTAFRVGGVGRKSERPSYPALSTKLNEHHPITREDPSHEHTQTNSR